MINSIRTTKEIRAKGNLLASEASLYLKQHAHNPFDWHPWGEAALERAREEDKLIFLSIGYSSCHWCHVMEDEVFENDGIAEYMNSHYVCIKVDREERPDIDSLYMTALQVMTGGGGWPMSMFLTPDLKPFYGATYIPAPQFSELAAQLNELYRSGSQDIARAAGEIGRIISRDTTPQGSSGTKLAALPAGMIASGFTGFDEVWGGTGHTQKFPTPPFWRFVLHYHRKTGDPEAALRLRLTLDRMADGGIRDHIGGGFHRYTVEPSWVVPHFEKMLYDNAQLASLYLEAAVVFDSPDYAAVGRDTLDFMLSDMYSPDGGFFASFDADSAGEEGSFYTWTPDELRAVAGEQDGSTLAVLLGVTMEGNFEGASIPTRRVDAGTAARLAGITAEEAAGLFQKWRPALLSKRARRTPPGLDRKIVTAWNGLAIEAMLAGYHYFHDERYLNAARLTAAMLLDTHRSANGGLYRTSTDGRPAGAGVVDDYALLASSLVSLFEATGEPTYLDAAINLAGYVLGHFAHADCGFYLTDDVTEVPLGRRIEVYDSVEPSGNAAMLHLLLDLAAITGDGKYRDVLAKTINTYGPMLEQAGREMSAWHDAVLRHNGPLYTVVIAGGDTGSGLELAAGTRWLMSPAVITVPVPATGAGAELLELAPPLAGKLAAGDGALAYVCEQGSCKAPSADLGEVTRQLMSGWAY